MIENAVIKSTFLGVEDHGILTCWLHLSMEYTGQGFGGYTLDEPKRDENGKFIGRFGTAYGMEFIKRILATLQVENWEKLPGTIIRINHEGGQIVMIGHAIKERWFEPTLLQGEFGYE